MSSRQGLDATAAAGAAIGGAETGENSACKCTQAGPSPVRRGCFGAGGRARRPQTARRWPPSLQTRQQRPRAWARWAPCSGSRRPSSKTRRHCICAHRLPRPQWHRGPGRCWKRHRQRHPSALAPQRDESRGRPAPPHHADADAHVEAHADAGPAPPRQPPQQPGAEARSPPSRPSQRPGQARPAPAARSTVIASAKTSSHCSASGQARPDEGLRG